MSKGQLTRQELSWLLTQEAQGAAERLRSGVEVIRNTLPPTSLSSELPQVVIGSKGAGDSGPFHLDASLDALEDAMRMLSSLHQKAAPRSRRGRVDMAALLWEVAPDARVAIAPGSGTEVFADEDDIRRMLQVLVSQTQGAGIDASVKRDGDEVRVVVKLGSEGASYSSETERAWLHRMAIRYGGRYELEGGLAVLALPADGVSERKEREALRKELDEARKQGELYAQELAAVWNEREERQSTPATLDAEMLDPVTVVVRLTRQLSRDMRVQVNALYTESRASSTPDVARSATEAASPLEKLLSLTAELAEFGSIERHELPSRFRVADLLTRLPQASRVEILETGDPMEAWAPEHLVQVITRALLVQAIAVSPGGQGVRVTIAAGVANAHTGSVPPARGYVQRGVRMHIDDCGAAPHQGARPTSAAVDSDSSTWSRPSGVLAIVSTLAEAAGLSFELGPVPGATTGLRATLGFSQPAK